MSVLLFPGRYILNSLRDTWSNDLDLLISSSLVFVEWFVVHIVEKSFVASYNVFFFLGHMNVHRSSC